MTIGRFLWGLAIVFVGLVFLLVNFGVLSPAIWGEIWRLWPLIIIIAGISVISNSLTRVGQVILSVLSVLIVIAGLVWILSPNRKAFDNQQTFNTTTNTQYIDEDLQEGKSSVVNIKTGAADLNISKSTDKLISGIIEGNFPVDLSRNNSNGTETVTLSSNVKRGMLFSRLKNRWDLSLNNSIPTKLEINTGAVDGHLDLADINLTELNVKSGASSYDITLGEKADRLTSEINIGASSVSIHLPKSVGLKVLSQTGASSNNFSNQGLSKTDNTYKSENYDQATKKIDLTFSAGASSIDLDRF